MDKFIYLYTIVKQNYIIMKFAVSYNTGLNHKEFDTMPEARRFAKKNKGSVAVVRTNSEGAKVLDWLNDKDQIVYTSKF